VRIPLLSFTPFPLRQYQRASSSTRSLGIQNLRCNRQARFQALSALDRQVRRIDFPILVFAVVYLNFDHHHKAHYRNANAPLLSLEQPAGVFTTVPQIFEAGLAKSPDGPCLGRLALISTSPTITYGDKYEWMSYTQVEHKRRNVGSATWRMFKSGGGSCGPDVGSEGTLETVGLWMANRPGMCVSTAKLPLRRLA
jgi:hypothetical protein